LEKTMNKLIVTALVSAGLVGTVPQALAQAAGPDGSRQGRHSMHGQQHGQPQGQRAFQSPTDRVEAQLAYLKTALKINGDQEAAWNTYAETRRKQARDASQNREKFHSQMAERQKNGTRPTAVERLEFRQAMLAAASARTSESLAATKPLYAALSSDQKKVADELLARGGHGHRGGEHRGPGPHGRA
jgi:LTXXQ motif family protein